MFLSLKETGSTGTNFCFNAATLSRVVSGLNLGCTRERGRQNSCIFLCGGSVLSLFRAFAGKGYFIFQFMWKYFIIFFSIFSNLFSEELPQDVLSESGQVHGNPKQKINSSIYMPFTSQRATPVLQQLCSMCSVGVSLHLV